MNPVHPYCKMWTVQSLAVETYCYSTMWCTTLLLDSGAKSYCLCQKLILEEWASVFIWQIFTRLWIGTFLYSRMTKCSYPDYWLLSVLATLGIVWICWPKYLWQRGPKSVACRLWLFHLIILYIASASKYIWQNKNILFLTEVILVWLEQKKWKIK